MARPPRRRPTLPDHDPRAIRAKLRRELYEYAATRRALDRIEFRAVESDKRPFLGLVFEVNGVNLIHEFDAAPLGWGTQLGTRGTLRDIEGRREIRFADPKSCAPECCGGERGTMTVRGRYVMWELDSPLFKEPLLFDRASYRESLEAAYMGLAAAMEPRWRAAWSITSRLDLTAAPVPGLMLCGVGFDGPSPHHALALSLLDPLWRTVIRLAPRWDGGDLESNVPRILSEVARWDEQALNVSWRPSRGGGVLHPPYPERWRRFGA